MLPPAAIAALLLAAPDVPLLAAPMLPPVPPPVGQAPAGSQPASPAGAAKATPPAQGTKPIPRGAVLVEISGVLEGFDRQAHQLTVGTASGQVTLSIDRNTMVYTAAGLGTVADLVPGSQLRAGRNADALAYWVQVRRPARGTDSSPVLGQGTGPGAVAPAEGGGATAPGAPPSGVGQSSAGPAPAPGTSSAPGTSAPAR